MLTPKHIPDCCETSSARSGRNTHDCTEQLQAVCRQQYLWKLDEGFAKLGLIHLAQLQTGLFSFPSLSEVILVVVVHKHSVALLDWVQDLIWDLRAM